LALLNGIMSGMNIKKLSAELGVSVCTVSRVLSGKARQYRIAEATEKKILAKACEIGFRPNYFAYSLNTGRTNTVGMIFANTIDNFLGSIMEGVESELRGTDFQMVVATCENNPAIEKLEIERMLHRRVDGIIIYPSAMPPGQWYPVEHIRRPDDKWMPYVIIGRQVEFEADHILFDDEVAGVRAAERLLAAGCRRFGLVTLPMECSANDGRIKGYLGALRNHGVPDTAIMTVCLRTPVDTADLAQLADIDALFGVNDISVMRCIEHLGRIRPLAGLRCEIIGTRPIFGPPLGVSAHYQIMPAREMGCVAARHLLQLMDTPAQPQRTVRLPWPESQS